MTQLSLSLALLDNFKFSSFFALPNDRELVELLQTDFWQSLPQLFIVGSKGTGKSHLLQAACYRIQETGTNAAYLSLRQLAAYGVRVLEGLDHQPSVLAIDDLDLVIGELEWETALLHFINHCRQNQQSLLLAANRDPHDLDCVLPDLASRLIWGPIYTLSEVSEEQAIDIFRQRAIRRGLEIPTPVLQYIIKRFPCNTRTLMDVMEKLDRASLNKGRRVTRNFVQEVFPLDNL